MGKVVNRLYGYIARCHLLRCFSLLTRLLLLLLVLQAPSATTRSMSVVLQGVISEQGVRGLWRGATPSVLRLIMLNSSMVATYDEVGWTQVCDVGGGGGLAGTVGAPEGGTCVRC